MKLAAAVGPAVAWLEAYERERTVGAVVAAEPSGRWCRETARKEFSWPAAAGTELEEVWTDLAAAAKVFWFG